MVLKEVIKSTICSYFNNEIDSSSVIIENPKERKLGDLALPCFTYAKILHKAPNVIANEIKEYLDNNCSILERVDAVGGYVNIFLDKKEVADKVINKIIEQKENYGYSDLGNGKTIVIDYSSPNIAKPFGVGHLRSTVIGNALKNICKKNGYDVIGINYLGDWGTQFGKMICAYKLWGDPEKVAANPIDELKNLYVKFHEEAEKDPSLEDAGRREFKALEDGNPESLKLWKWFRDESLVEFKKTYSLLGVDDFDSWQGESFYNDKMAPVVKELEDKHLLEESEGAMIVVLDNDLPPALIKRSDGATLYITRDLAAAIYRKKEYNFTEALYVVGNEQSLHFNQLKQVLSKMGYPWSDNIHHISFGLILQNGKKMSTRHGKSVKLQDVLEEAVSLSKEYMLNRNSSLDNIDYVSEKVGVGAVIFNDLKNYRINDIEFHLEDILKFEGETGPYIQYTYARIMSLLENKKNIKVSFDNVTFNEYEWYLTFNLYQFSDVIRRAKENYDPSEVAKYLIDLAKDFNKWYALERMIDDDIEKTESRLLVAEATAIVIKEGMRLLGIEVLNKM